MSLLLRFLKTLFVPARKPRRKLGKNEKFDITLSLWNVFRSREQRRGFEASGQLVHWIGNHYPPECGEVTKRSFAWLSFLTLMTHFFLIKTEWVKFLSMSLFDWYSGTRKLNTRLVWAYVEMNTRLIRKAKRKGIPVILDNPIAHMRDYYEVLKPEYEALGLKFHDALIRKWVLKAEEEYRLADWFNVGSSFVKETLVKRGVPAERIIVTHTGVNTSQWANAFAKRVENRSKMTFVSTGYIGVRKGTQYLIKAWIRANLRDAELILCGGGTMPWDKICDKMPDNIRFMGAVNHDQLSDIYSRSDVYVLPSLMEGFSRSGLEAMASGLPLVITYETGLTDMCDHGVEGWVVPSRNVDALANQLIWCRNHPQEVSASGKMAFARMKGQDFGSYGLQCAHLARSIIDGTISQHNK